MSFNRYLSKNVDYNYEWLTGKTLKAIGKLPNLKVLNISMTDYIKVETT